MSFSFFCLAVAGLLYSQLHHLLCEGVYEEDDYDHTENVDGQRLYHGKANQHGCHDFRGGAWISAYTFDSGLNGKSLPYTGPESSNSHGKSGSNYAPSEKIHFPAPSRIL